MLPDITYNYTKQGESSLGPRWQGVHGIPAEITKAQDLMTGEEAAWARLLGFHYRQTLVYACNLLSPHKQASEHAERDELIKRLERAAIMSWTNALVVEVGFSLHFRAVQTISGMNLEDVARLLLVDTMIWTEFGLSDTTLDILYAPASDPGPPYDSDTDYAIFVVPQGMRGVSPASRYNADSPHYRP